MADKYIKKIKLENEVYYVYDAGAPRTSDLDNYLPLSGGTITGNLEVDQQIKAGTLKIQSVEYIQEGTGFSILVYDSNGNVKQESADNLLKDIGGISYSMDDTTGTLSFKFGKQ